MGILGSRAAVCAHARARTCSDGPIPSLVQSTAGNNAAIVLEGLAQPLHWGPGLEGLVGALMLQPGCICLHGLIA